MQCERSHKFWPIQRLHPVERGSCFARLVRLQMANQMPFQIQIRQFALLGDGFLHVVLAECVLLEHRERTYLGGRAGLRHGQ